MGTRRPVCQRPHVSSDAVRLDASVYRVKSVTAERLLSDGDAINLGGRRFEVIHTPGHSPGAIALYEAATGTLIASDIVYDGDLVADAFSFQPRRLSRPAGAPCMPGGFHRSWRAPPELRPDAT